MVQSLRQHLQWAEENYVHFITTNVCNNTDIFPKSKKTFSDYMRGIKSHSSKKLLQLNNIRFNNTQILSPDMRGRSPDMRGCSPDMRGCSPDIRGPLTPHHMPTTTVQPGQGTQPMEKGKAHKPTTTVQPGQGTQPMEKGKAHKPTTTVQPGQGTQPMGKEAVYPKRRMSQQIHKVWQPGFFDYLIDNYAKLEEKIEYIKQNPVKAGLTDKPEDYRWLYVGNNINLEI